MYLSREHMIVELRKLKGKDGKEFRYCKVKGGQAPLEEAPTRNIYRMYMRVTGNKK